MGRRFDFSAVAIPCFYDIENSSLYAGIIYGIVAVFKRLDNHNLIFKTKIFNLLYVLFFSHGIRKNRFP
jgi:hypothetical protein